MRTKWVNRVWFGAVLALVANAAADIYNVDSLVKSQRIVAHTRTVQTDLAEILSALKDAETGHRGFLIANRPDYLEPYRAALKELPGKQKGLRALIADDEGQTKRFDAVEELIVERLSILGNSVRLIEAGDGPAAVAVFVGGRGKRVMDLLRERIGEMSDVEADLMRDRSEDVAEKFRSTVSANVIGTALALAVVTLAHYVVRKELNRRVKAEAAVRATNDRLEATIETRTKALTQTTAELLRSNQELEKFAYVASHDLQEPLRKIQAFGDRLKRKAGDALDETGRDYVDRMQTSATRMRTLINDLLAYSRVSMQTHAFAEVDLLQVVTDVVSDLEPRIEECGGRVDVGPLPTLHADPTQMRQLFQNLIANALKFRRPGVVPTVTVRATAAADLTALAAPPPPATGWRIVVTDNGIGFDPAYSERIFELFQRLHGRGEYDGTGIGLAVCRKIVERHGGRIVAHGQPDTGAEFLIDLPDLTEPVRAAIP